MKISGLREVQTMNNIDQIVENIVEAITQIKNFNGEKTVECIEEDNVSSKIEVSQPSNIEAIVEGLLYIVGDDGIKVEQLASTIEKSEEDAKLIFINY